MAYSVEKLEGVAFLPFAEMDSLLISECERRFGLKIDACEKWGDFFYVPSLALDDLKSVSEKNDDGTEKIFRYDSSLIPYWCRCAMVEPVIIRFDSIGDGAKALRDMQRSWAPCSSNHFRRTSLIQEKLPHVNLKSRDFPISIPRSPIGVYCLLDEHTMVASAKTNSCLPAGTVVWNEDHENPPSRAYLKVQEALALHTHFFGSELPGKNSRCFDAGACPGGWTWVLTELGSEVFAVDRAELAPSLMKNPLVTFMAHDAFTLPPEDLGHFDWVFSDVICYPERLLGWVQKWIDSGLCDNMICTIKMQGEIRWDLIVEFASIPGSRVVHLNYNKHELTFLSSTKHNLESR